MNDMRKRKSRARSGKKAGLGPESTIGQLEKAINEVMNSAEFEYRIEYAGGKKVSKQGKLKKLWSGWTDPWLKERKK